MPDTETRRIQLAWLDQVTKTTGWSLAKWADKAKIHPSALVNFKTGGSPQRLLPEDVIQHLKNAAGCGPELILSKVLPEPNTLDEFLNITHCPKWIDQHVFQALTALHPDAELKLLVTNKLQAIGYLAGDVLITEPGFDLNTRGIVTATIKASVERRVVRLFMRP